jgi:hypothetical protein
MKNGNKLETIKEHINNLEKSSINYIEANSSFSISDIYLPQKIKNMIIDDYYNVNICKKLPVIPANLSINDIIQQYLNSKATKFNIIKKNDIINKINPQFKLITSINEHVFKTTDLEMQLLYIKDIINMLKGFMIMSVNSIIYTTEEKLYTFNILESKEDTVLNLLGVTHLLRYIIQAPYIVKFFFSNNFANESSDHNYKVFSSIIEDLISFLDKIL